MSTALPPFGQSGGCLWEDNLHRFGSAAARISGHHRFGNQVVAIVSSLLDFAQLGQRFEVSFDQPLASTLDTIGDFLR